MTMTNAELAKYFEERALHNAQQLGDALTSLEIVDDKLTECKDENRELRSIIGDLRSILNNCSID
jgi:hypothetical protein